MGEGSGLDRLTDPLDMMFISGAESPRKKSLTLDAGSCPPIPTGEKTSIGDRSVRLRIDLRGPAQNQAGPIGGAVGGW